MFGLIVLAVLAGYVGLAVLVAKRFRSKAARRVVAAIAVLIPTGDMIVGRVYFSSLCARERGTQIYATVDNVSGIYSEVLSPDSNAVGAAKLSGYSFMELPAPGGGVYRYTLAADGEIKRELRTDAESPFSLSRKWTPELLTVKRLEILVVDTRRHVVLARHVEFLWEGGWIAAFYKHKLLGSVAAKVCPDRMWDYREYVNAVLKPAT